jgi:hypothetical protein
MLRAPVVRAIILVIAALSADSLAAQTPNPARTQTIRGRVIAADTGEAIFNARVTASGNPRGVRTSVEGRFSISAPPNVAIAVTKPGYLRTESPAGAAEIRMTRTAAISGRVLDDRGDPIVGALVVAATPDKIGAPVRESARISTDDRGEYRLGGLPPQRYIVFINMAGAQIERRDLGGGRFSAGPSTYTTYFPDTSNRDDAAHVTLSAGEERSDIDFHLIASRLSAAMREGLPERIVPILSPTQLIGTATISGSITSTTGRPLRATVVLYGPDPRSFPDQSIKSGDDGRYEFTGLPAGKYQVAAARAGFSLPPDRFPPFTAARLGVETTVSADQDRDGVDIELQPWGAISGRVLDEAGEPVQGAFVGLMTVRYERGRRRLVPANTPQRYTDDRGAFRIYSVPPGQYVLAASVSDTLAFDLAGYGPTYYPGTAAAGEARFTTMRAGSEVTSLEFSLVPAATATVSGKLFDATGKPTTGGSFNLIPRSSLSSRIDARIGEDGSFTFRNVPPGQYVIQADRGRRSGSTEGEFGAFPVTVGGGDLSGLVLRTSTGSRIAGHVVFEGATADAPPARGVSISPIPVDYDLTPSQIAVTEPDDQSRFELFGISGARRLQVTRVPSGWAVKAIVANGRDITDEVVAFGRADQSLDDVQVILTDRVSEVVGRVTDDRARAVAAASVIVFSADRTRWYPASRFMRSATTDDGGSFRISGLPAGSYFIAPAVTIPAGDAAWGDPVFLDTLRPGATVLSIGDDQAQSVTLRLPRQ